MSEIKNIFEGKTVLITGGCGSIGKEIVKQVLKFNPKQVRVFDYREYALHKIESAMGNPEDKMRYLLGDIRDKERIYYAMRGVDIVFHAAALKHVKHCEYNPFEAIKTNVYGAQNLIHAAIENHVERVVSISTDKAANPCNVLGATKLLMEKLIAASNAYSGRKDLKFVNVRFGNVLNSDGSVIPLWKKQIESGGPLTLTHPDATRFFMSISRAVGLVLKAASEARDNQLFIVDMPSLKIKDLAEVMIEELAPGKSVPIENIGLRYGEKMHEVLINDIELDYVKRYEDLFIVELPSVVKSEAECKVPENKRLGAENFISNKPEGLLSKEEIRVMLRETGILQNIKA